MEMSIKLHEMGHYVRGPKHIQASQLNNIKSDGHFTLICISLFHPSKDTYTQTLFTLIASLPVLKQLQPFIAALRNPLQASAQSNSNYCKFLMTGCICLRILSLYDHSTHPVSHNLTR